MSILSLLIYSLLVLVVLLSRLLAILPNAARNHGSTRRRGASDTCSLGVFLGSGGHTSEMLALVSALDFTQYAPRIYIISEGDSLSAEKARELEAKVAGLRNLVGIAASYEVVVVPRARQVHQSLISTPPTALRSLLSIQKYLLRNFGSSRKPLVDVLLLNGPGTCFILAVAVYILKFLGMAIPRTIYVESFARVHTLSLSGKLLRPVVDSAMAAALERWPSGRVPWMARVTTFASYLLPIGFYWNEPDKPERLSSILSVPPDSVVKRRETPVIA